MLKVWSQRVSLTASNLLSIKLLIVSGTKGITNFLVENATGINTSNNSVAFRTNENQYIVTAVIARYNRDRV